MSKTLELEEYRIFTGPAELHKAVNILKGIVGGISTDYQISVDEINELSYWCVAHKHLSDRHPFKELIPMIESAYSDGIITSDESSDIIGFVIILFLILVIMILLLHHCSFSAGSFMVSWQMDIFLMMKFMLWKNGSLQTIIFRDAIRLTK